MSRLAHLLTQLATTSHTQEKLAATYFDPVTPRPAPMPPRPRLWALAGVAALLGICVGVAISTSRQTWPRAASRNVPIYPVLTFDEPTAWELLGQRFGAWWGTPGAPDQSLALSLDRATYAGSSGQSLRVDYALPAEPRPSAPLGIWFMLPNPAMKEPYQLELWVRGNARAGFSAHALLELRSDDVSEQRPLMIGPTWSPVRIRMIAHAGPDGRMQHWKECRILLDRDRVTATRGRLYIDQVQFTALTP